jgi:branched-chain amino acid transport system permease protein
VLILVLLGCANLLRAPTGRALMAIRDSEISAQSMGIPVARYKAIAFGLSAGITGLAGGLFAHKFSYLAPDAFNIILSVQLLLMVVVGGLGSLHGAIYGAMFIGFLPQALALLRDYLPAGVANTPGLEAGIFGLILMLFIIFEPQGLYGRWRKVKLYFELFPLYRKATFKRQKVFLKTERLQ